MEGILRMTTLEVLQRAREYLTDQNHWCVGYLVRWCGGDDYQHCAVGAVNRFSSCPDGTFNQCRMAAMSAASPASALAVQRLAKAVKRLSGTNPLSDERYAVAVFNNTQGHARTLEMFDVAIALELAYMEEVAGGLVDSATPQGAECGVAFALSA